MSNNQSHAPLSYADRVAAARCGLRETPSPEDHPMEIADEQPENGSSSESSETVSSETSGEGIHMTVVKQDVADLLNMNHASSEIISSEDDMYSDDEPIEYVGQDDSHAAPPTICPTPRASSTRPHRNTSLSRGTSPASQSGNTPVEGVPIVDEHIYISPKELSDQGVTEIPREYSGCYEVAGKKRVALAFEIPLAAFGDNVYGAAGLSDDLDISLSMIDHRNPRYFYVKVVAMLLGRLCTLGEVRTGAMKTCMSKDQLRTPLNGRRITPEDLFDSQTGAVRFDKNFCNHPAYIAMLCKNVTTRTFSYTKERFVNMQPEEVPVTAAQDEDYRGSSEDESTVSTPPAQTTRTVMRKHVERCTVENVPQFSILWEELVDHDFQPKGWRLWILVNDPAINLGTNLDYVMRESTHLSSLRANSRRPSSLVGNMNTHTCYNRVDSVRYRNSILRNSSVMGTRHPIQQIPMSEGPRPSESDRGNAFFPANAFHGYYTVLFGPTQGVCRAQRDPTRYFNFSDTDVGHIDSFESIARLNTPEALRNASQVLPTFDERFPFDILTTPWSAATLSPTYLWSTPLPLHVRERACLNPDLALKLQSLTDALQESALILHGMDPPVPLRINLDDSSEGSTDWDRVFSEAQAMQDREFQEDCFHGSNPREFFRREHRQSAYDPLAKLSISAEDKATLFARDALLRFNIYASGKKRNLRKAYRGKDYKELTEKMNELKATLLVEMQEKVRVCEGDPTQMPESFATGYSWYRALRSEEQWPEFNASIQMSDSDNLMSSFANMIVQFYDGVKDLFWLNEGEILNGVMRAVLCRNTSLHLVFDMKCNLILWGGPGSGKSMMLHCAEQMAAPGHVLNLTHMTEHTFTTDENICYVWIVMEEGEAAILGIDKKSGKEVAGDAILKNILALGLAISMMCQIVDTRRKRIKSVSILMAAFAVCNNYILPPETNPMQSRFLRDVISVHQQVASTALLAAEENDGCLRTDEDTREEQLCKYRVWHWDCHVVERMIGGVFDDVNMTVFNTRMPLFSQWMETRCKIPVRKQKMFYEAARSLTIKHGVYAHFYTEIARATHKVVMNNGRFRRRTFSDFLGIEKHLVHTEEMFVFVMTLFQRFYLPVCEYEVIQGIKAFLRGHALLHPSIDTYQGIGTMDDLLSHFDSSGNYLGRRPITVPIAIEDAEGEDQHEDDLLGDPLDDSVPLSRALVESARHRSVGTVFSGRPRARERRREQRSTDQEFYESTELMYDEGTAPSAISTVEVEALLDIQYDRDIAAGEGPSLHANNSELVACRPSGRRPRTQIVDTYDRNYIGLRCRRKPEIVMSITTYMKKNFTDGAIYAILSSLLNRSLEVDDLNAAEPGTKVRQKVLRWMNCSTTTKGYGAAYRTGNFRRTTSEGMYFINAGALVQHFREIDICSELQKFMSHMHSHSATFITAVPYKDEPGYLSILSTIEITRDRSHPLINKHALPPSRTHNATVYNSLSSRAQAKRITHRQSIPFHLIDKNLDVLALYQHYKQTCHFVRDDVNCWIEDLKTYWPLYIARIWRYRMNHPQYYSRLEYIQHYPKAKLEEVERGRVMLSIVADLTKRLSSTGPDGITPEVFSTRVGALGANFSELMVEQYGHRPDAEPTRTLARPSSAPLVEGFAPPLAFAEQMARSSSSSSSSASLLASSSSSSSSSLFGDGQPMQTPSYPAYYDIVSELSLSITDAEDSGQDDLDAVPEEGAGYAASVRFTDFGIASDIEGMAAPVVPLEVQECLNENERTERMFEHLYPDATHPVPVLVHEEVDAPPPTEVSPPRAPTRGRRTRGRSSGRGERQRRRVRPRVSRGPGTTPRTTSGSDTNE